MTDRQNPLDSQISSMTLTHLLVPLRVERMRSRLSERDCSARSNTAKTRFDQTIPSLTADLWSTWAQNDSRPQPKGL
ncbi:MAG: hypothetical protein RIB98_05120 [Acidimicrobiales bacterium]